MNILLVVATQPEIGPFLSKYADADKNHHLIIGSHLVQILITGAGMVATAFALGKHLAINKYDLAINAGIAGSFGFNLALGDVVLVNEDVFADHGAEDGENFLSIDEMGFGESRQLPNKLEIESLNTKAFKQVKAITVNKVHGNEFSIEKVIARVNPQIESMEGAAFFYACNKSFTPCIQIRSISNYVERRNREKWNIGLAIKNLNEALVKLLEE
ncbi:MAG: futalosine hydrolase [Sphingobacteriales bacterium]|nr:futalosine hydrolase [Sphingobacteriales bacterium]